MSFSSCNKGAHIKDASNGHKCKYIQVAPIVVCSGMPHLETVFQDIIDEGGEGIILRDPKAPYQAGRCPGYLKHKVRFSRFTR